MKSDTVKRDVIIFVITFLVNSSIIWILFIPEATKGPSIYVGMIVLPFIGGISRGLFSRSDRFLLITLIWGVILAFVYVPLYGSALDYDFGFYPIYMYFGFFTSCNMIASSLFPFYIRRHFRKKTLSEEDKKIIKED